AFCTLGRNKAAVGWLVLASLVFYGYWNPIYLLLLFASLLINYRLGSILSNSARLRPALLVFGVALNLGNIGYFKYANFFVDNINTVAQTTFSIGEIALPLGISFYTFQQIAFLVDSYRKQTRERDFLNYCLFVTYFPQLIAGPIVHHAEIIPQFEDPKTFRFDSMHLATGITIFSVGLFKKVVLADGIAPYANHVFAMAEASDPSMTFFTAWGGALAYTFQLYFDFSGYSDMAIGLARMIGINIPINFNSPYKSGSIIEFWRRWHITLSRFLRDYLYIPLGGNQKGEVRRYLNVMVTMLLGGLWHGASWNFVLWGGLHGLFLVVNNIWRELGFSGPRHTALARVYRMVCVAITFAVVVLAWVIFRAPTLDGATAMYSALFGLNGVVMPASFYDSLNIWGLGNVLQQLGVSFDGPWAWDSIGQLFFLTALGLVALFAPNATELFQLYGTKLPDHWKWTQFNMSYRWIAFTALILGGSVLIVLSHRVSEFLYFEF
ncbi:MAG: MBOAT family protein, partial [Candidatus Hydrogenedentes bacterium]|nr:MBOAT family protein [Candidatus Hydrogenedentota bacterium]